MPQKPKSNSRPVRSVATPRAPGPGFSYLILAERLPAGLLLLPETQGALRHAGVPTVKRSRKRQSSRWRERLPHRLAGLWFAVYLVGSRRDFEPQNAGFRCHKSPRRSCNCATGGRSAYSSGCPARLIQLHRKPNAAAPAISHRLDDWNDIPSGAIPYLSVTRA